MYFRDHVVRQTRRGLASLEYAMALPILLIIFAAILSTAYIGLGREHAGVEVRYKAWKDREQQHTGKPLFFFPQDQALVVTKQRDVKIYFTTRTIAAPASLALLGGCWDYKDLDPGKDMAKTTTLMIASQGASAVGDVSYIINNFGSLLSLSSITQGMFSAMATAQQQTNDQTTKANKVKDDERKKNAADLAQARKDLATAQAKKTQDDKQLAKLQADRKEAMKITDATKKQAKLKEIDAGIAQVNKSLKADEMQIAAAQKQISILEKAAAEMNAL